MEIRDKTRVVLIGLDGTPYTLIRQLIADGTMPKMAELVRRGALLQMDTSIPDISSVAWASFMTGANPGRHGIYGFVDLQPNSYRLYFPNSRHIKSETLWSVAGRAGRRAVVINVPSTYPAQPLDGILIAGFVAVDLSKATFPQELVPTLRRMNYRIDVDARKVQESHAALMDDILVTLERRVEALLHFFDKQNWDVFIGVVTETDRLQHFFMDAAEDACHPYHSAFREFYSRVDDFLGQIAERLRDETFLIISDHGFTPIKQQVYLNRWLVENGYLKLKEGAQTIEDIEEGSLAFALDPGRIYVNLKGKYPKGAVDVADLRRVLEEIKQGLSEISAEGMPIIKRIYFKEELYRGPLADYAPDLCVQTVYGYDLKGAVNKQQLMDKEVFTGMHTQDDAMLFISTPRLSALSSQLSVTHCRAHITDVAPTVLEELGLAVPESMDGRSLVKRL
jgi:predicted AlkP superfamily phosphohydrolase/phosphomutase